MGDLFAWLFNLLLIFLIVIFGYQGVFSFVHFLSRHWFMFLVSLPCLYFNVRLYITKENLADVTQIHNQIGCEKKQRFL